MHGECASPIEFVVIIMLIKFVKLKILVYLVFFMNVKFLFTTFLESSMSKNYCGIEYVGATHTFPRI